MISKKYIKSLEFETIEDIYSYIVQSEINGATAQYKEILNKLSSEQFKEFISWLELDYIQIQKALRFRK